LSQSDRMRVAVAGKDQFSLGKSISAYSRLRDIPTGMPEWTVEGSPAVESAPGTGVCQLILPSCLSGPVSILRDEEEYILLLTLGGVFLGGISTSGSLLKHWLLSGESDT
jgi:hypothetical protein